MLRANPLNDEPIARRNARSSTTSSRLSPRSHFDTKLWVSPNRLASSSWVRPARSLASRRSPRKARYSRVAEEGKAPRERQPFGFQRDGSEAGRRRKVDVAQCLSYPLAHRSSRASRVRFRSA